MYLKFLMRKPLYIYWHHHQKYNWQRYSPVAHFFQALVSAKKTKYVKKVMKMGQNMLKHDTFCDASEMWSGKYPVNSVAFVAKRGQPEGSEWENKMVGNTDSLLCPKKIRWEPDNHSVKFEINRWIHLWVRGQKQNLKLVAMLPICFPKWDQFPEQPSLGAVLPACSVSNRWAEVPLS